MVMVINKIWTLLFTVSVVEETIGTGGERSRSPFRRFVFDANHKFSGWASWEQYAACSTRCVSGYETDTKRCCETGDNRLCYYLPWDQLKVYIGTCPNETTATQTPSSTLPTTTTKTTRATTKTSSTPSSTLATTTKATAKTTTFRGPYTIPPKPTTCKVCSGPLFLCEQIYVDKQCNPPNNYCINKLSNHKDGTRTVTRGCGTFDTCYRDWFLGSSDADKCRIFDENDIRTYDFDCTYCCITDGCNESIRPPDRTLYKDL